MMNSLTNFIVAHWGSIAASVSGTGYLIAAAAINAMEPITTTSTPRYRYWYRFLNGLPIPTLHHSSSPN